MPPGELERIRWIAKTAGIPAGKGVSGRTILGIGDDAALWKAPAGHAAVLTVDVQVEGVHFHSAWLRPEEIGIRAVASSASDLAAMAARPAGILVAISLPGRTTERFFRGLYGGILEEARRLGLAVLGGNLSAGPLQVSITSIGSARPEEAVARAGARPGDGLYVTGWPGRAFLGQALLSRKGMRKKLGRGAAGKACVRAFATPRARIEEARWIAGSARPRALIDLSDGLALDLSRILERSAAPGRSPGADLSRDSIISLLEEDGCHALASRLGVSPLGAALEGGEDYELLLAAPAAAAERASENFRKRFGIPLTRIGTVTRQRGLRLMGKGIPGKGRKIRPGGFDHFG